ncbi:MAG: DUF6718 family protein [Bacilli bacterium]
MYKSKDDVKKIIYIIAKEFNKVGSLVLKIKKDDDIVKLIMDLSQEFLDTDIEIIETNNIEAFKEYYPIEIIEDPNEFKIRTLKMIKKAL